MMELPSSTSSSARFLLITGQRENGNLKHCRSLKGMCACEIRKYHVQCFKYKYIYNIHIVYINM